MMNPIALLSLSAALLPSALSADVFKVRAPERRHLDEGDDVFILTHSDDGRSKTLQPFFVDIFDTAGDLSADAIPIVRMAMEKFLLDELNTVYTDNEVDSVGVEILSSGMIEASSRRYLQEGTGTEVMMEVTCTFDNEPSPPKKKVAALVRDDIMVDLQDYVNNITLFEHEELSEVYVAYRRELPTDRPTPAPVDNTDPIRGAETKEEGDSEDNGKVAANVLPAVLGAVSLVALAVYLVFRRKRRSSTDESEPPKGDMMYVDVENDLYSLDRSLGSGQSPNADSAGYSVSTMELPPGSLFSGLSPTSTQHKAGKSLLSGFTNASANTYQISNTEKNAANRAARGKAVRSSLYGFNEEDQEYDIDGLVIRGKSPRMMLGSEDTSDDDMAEGRDTPTGSDGSSLRGAGIAEPPTSTTSSVLSSCFGANHSPATSDRVLADLEVLESSRGSRDLTRDPTPTSVKDNATRDPTPRAASSPRKKDDMISYNPFNCNPIIPTEEGADEGANITPSSMSMSGSNQSKFSAKATKKPDFEDSETPLRKNHASPTASDAKNMAMMSAKATQIVGGVYDDALPAGQRGRSNTMDDKPSTPRSVKSTSRSEPSTPERHFAGGNWLKARKAATSPPTDGDYEMNLSRPSTPGNDVNSSLAVSDYESSAYGCLPFGRLVNRTPGADAPGADADETFPGGGRHHSGNNDNVDGSAMYQTSAMHPMDWSYKSADLASHGESTISGEASNGMPRQFNFKKGAGGGETNLLDSKTPRSEGSTLTGGADTAGGESQASASRQLINDLVWLEKKIADVRESSSNGPVSVIENADSLSYASGDDAAFISRASSQESEDDPTVFTNKDTSVMSSIVCRDCYAPPGKLHIVIHSTKDGPAVHTVKEGSSLEGHIFPGDLIISVDNVDTRSFTAEQVMKMMASKSDNERKITVLHFEEDA